MIPNVSCTIGGHAVDLQDWQCSAVRIGGYKDFTAAVLERVARRWPSSFAQGAPVSLRQWNGRPLWEGRLTLPPSFENGLAMLVGAGPMADAQAAATRRMYQIRSDTSAWADATAPPFNRGDSGSIDGFIDPGALRWIVTEGIAVNTGDAYPLTLWALGATIRRYAFTIEGTNAGYDVRVNTAPGPDGAVNYQLDPDWAAGDIDHNIPPAEQEDTLVIRMRRDGGNVGSATYFRGRLYDVRVNDIAPGDEFLVSDVVKDVGRALGWDVSGVTESALNAMPLDWSSGDWLGLLQYVSDLDDRHTRVVSNPNPYDPRPYLDSGPDAREWTLFRAKSARPQLAPLPLYNQIIVNYNQANGGKGQVVLDAVPDPLNGRVQSAFSYDLADTQPDESLAESVATSLGERYFTPRYAGQVDIWTAQDATGRGNLFDVLPGDLARIEDWGPGEALSQRIEEVVWKPTEATLGINTPVSVDALIARIANESLRSGAKPAMVK